MASIAVLEYGQSPESEPIHFVSKHTAAQFIAYFHNGKRVAVKLTDYVIRIVVPVAFGKLKGLLRGRGLAGSTVRRAFWRECLLLTYPCPDKRTTGCYGSR